MKVLVDQATKRAVFYTHTPVSEGFVVVDVPYSPLSPIQRPWEYDEASGTLKTVPKPPRVISAWQARAALQLTPHEGGTLLDAVEALIAELPTDTEQGVVIRTAWNSNAQLDRQSDAVLTLAAELGLSESQLDGLFLKAGQLTV